jgi:hypothetical protein
MNGASIAEEEMSPAKGSATYRVLWLLLLLILGQRLVAQSSSETTETQFLPEADLHIQLRSHLRVLAFLGLQQGIGYPYRQWYAAGAVGRQFKTILKPHAKNIDADKEHYFVSGAGYEFLRTTQSGKVKDESRITVDFTPSLRPASKLLLRDRNWVEFRWIDGSHSTTYRNQLSLEYDLLVRDVRLTPFGSVEAFYDGSKHEWDQEWYTAGIQIPYKHSFMAETYYRREHCVSCTPADWDIAGLTLHFYFSQD